MKTHYLLKPAARGAVAFVLAAGLMLPFAVPGQAYAASDGAKDEVVYAKAAANGETQGIYVVNVFDSQTDAQVSDPANYTSVQNLTTTQVLEQKNGVVELSTTANTPFYYQGNLDAASQLPWNISIRYYLDGAEKQPAELSGANGQLKVVLDVQPVEEGDVSDFATSYILQAKGTFAEDAFTISDGGDATIAHSGSDQVATCLVLPGEGATFEITGTAHNFSYDGWQIAGMPLSMAVDLASQDTSKLTGQTQELEDATSQLSSGASELSNGTSQVDGGAQSLASGASQLSSGVDSAVSGLSQLSSAGSSLVQGWNSVASGVNSLDSAASQLQAGSNQFEQGLESSAQEYASAASQLANVKAAYAQAAQAAKQALASGDTEAAAQAVAQMDAYAQQLAQVSAASGAYQALAGVEDSYSTLDSGIDALASSTPELASGAQSFGSGLFSYVEGAGEAAESATQLQEGAAQVAEGAGSLSSATSQLSSGASTLASGSETLANSVSGLDQKIIEELQNVIDEKLGKDFKPHSYVVPGNTNVDAVQFVYVVEGISEPDETMSETNGSSENLSFLDRFVALFTSQE